MPIDRLRKATIFSAPDQQYSCCDWIHAKCRQLECSDFQDRPLGARVFPRRKVPSDAENATARSALASSRAGKFLLMRRTWIRLSALRDPAILSGLVTGDDEWTTSSKLNRDRRSEE